jgi:hypothetical protein
MIPNAKGFRDGIDVCTIAVAVENKFKLVVAATQVLVGDFSAHDVRGVAD